MQRAGLRVTTMMAVPAIGLLALTWPAAAQTLTLDDALRRADGQAYANRMSAASAYADGAQATAALRGILPTVRIEAGAMRTTDPIGAFGTTLRQRRIEQQDFDPTRLNHPSATDNVMGAVVLEAPLLNADAYLGRGAAARAADAAEAGAYWTRVNTRVDVIRAYYGAVLAAEKVATLELADRAAQGHAAQAERLVSAGLATKSDALLARVRAGEVEVALLEARGEAEIALRGLGVLLGEADADLTVPSVLPSTDAVRHLLSATLQAESSARADVTAAALGVDAARWDTRRAQSLHLPRVNGFARYDWNSPTTLYGGDRNWTVGVMATWTVFGGGSEWAERRGASGRERAARAGLEAARAQALLEIEQAETSRRVALARLAIAERGARQSAEAHRIVTRKYEGGLATALEVLDAAAVETQSALALSHARYAGVVAEAERRRALGLDPAEIAAQLTNTAVGMTR